MQDAVPPCMYLDTVLLCVRILFQYVAQSDPKRHVFQTVTSTLAHDKLEASLSVKILRKPYVERQYLNYSF